MHQDQGAPRTSISPESVSRTHEALGQSEPFLNLQEQLSRVAPSTGRCSFWGKEERARSWLPLESTFCPNVGEALWWL